MSFDRRQFIQLVAMLSASGVLTPTATAMTSSPEPENTGKLEDPWLTLAAVQQHLFPADDDSPGAADIHALTFLRNMLDTPDTDSEEKAFILKGVGWLNDLSQKQFQQRFFELNPEQKEPLLRKVERSDAGGRWLSLMMTYLLEALLSDPAYGGNFEGAGWKWLEHQPGFPRPQADQVYHRLNAYASPKRRTRA